MLGCGIVVNGAVRVIVGGASGGPQFLMSYDADRDGTLSKLEFQLALEADPFLVEQFAVITALPVCSCAARVLRVAPLSAAYGVAVVRCSSVLCRLTSASLDVGVGVAVAQHRVYHAMLQLKSSVPQLTFRILSEKWADPRHRSQLSQRVTLPEFQALCISTFELPNSESRECRRVRAQVPCVMVGARVTSCHRRLGAECVGGRVQRVRC